MQSTAPEFHAEALRADSDCVPEASLISQASFSQTTRMELGEELTKPFTRGWVVRLGHVAAKGSPIGILVAWHVADELHILNVATSPLFRGRGVGRMLMDESLAYARAHQVRLMLLEVRLGNESAIRLYRRCGFYAIGLRPGYYSDNGEDALEMVLVLDPETGHIVSGRDEVQV